MRSHFVDHSSLTKEKIKHLAIEVNYKIRKWVDKFTIIINKVKSLKIKKPFGLQQWDAKNERFSFFFHV